MLKRHVLVCGDSLHSRKLLKTSKGGVTRLQRIQENVRIVTCQIQNFRILGLECLNGIRVKFLLLDVRWKLVDM